MTVKNVLKKIVKNGVEYQVGEQKLYVITEDMVSVSTTKTKGVEPYNVDYYYTNIVISATAGIKWEEGAIYNFVIDTEMIATSSYRNVRIKIGSGGYIPAMGSSGVILGGNSYFSKANTRLFQYSTKYESGGALHLFTDSNTTYSAMSVAEGQTGTATTGRSMRADYLKEIIKYHSVDNTAYGSSWDGITDLAPSKNAVYDKIASVENDIQGKIDNPTGGSVGDVLTKTANGEERQAPSGGGGGGDLDINGVNVLIDMKLGDYDSLFSVSSGLYKILNAIDTDDEIGLSSGESWTDIVSNDTSMSKISHCYAVMCYIANSSVAMNTILADSSATEEISECWNSISIIAECELASNLYLSSVNGITYLFTYTTAQDAFFTSLARKSEIVSENIMVIVNNNNLLTFLNTDDIVKACIVSNQTALNTIAGDSTKLEIVKNNTTIMNAIASNYGALSHISDSDFFSYILENSTYLNTCANSIAGRGKINSYTADDLLEPIYFWTGDLEYSTFAELAEDDTAMETVQSSTEAMLIIESNDEAKGYIGFVPTANTVGYFPFKEDALDKTGNLGLTQSGTQETLGRTFTTTTTFSDRSKSASIKFISVWLKINSGLNGTSCCTQLFDLGTTPCCYVTSHSDSPLRNTVHYSYNGGRSRPHANTGITQGSWYHLAYGYYDGTIIMRVNGVKTIIGSGCDTNNGGNDLLRMSGLALNITLSDYIAEYSGREDSEVVSYFNKVKSNYGY